MMNSVRNSFVYCGLVLLLVALVAVPVAAQGDYSQVQIETTKLTDHIYMLKGAGGNIGLCVGDDGVFLVDDQYAPLSEKIIAAIAEITGQQVQFILNTHWHGDHTGGNENFGKTGSMLVSHANVRRRLATDQFSTFFNETVPASPDIALPVVTFTDSLTFYYNDEEIIIFHVPHAHTDGDGAVHFPKANVVHSGDIIFFGLYPYIDVSAGGTIDGIIAGARIVLGLSDDETQIIPGHGPLLNKAQVREYIDMVEGVRDAVASEKAAGKDLAATIAAKPAAKWDEKWGKVWLTSDQFVEMVYATLK
jgi:cyclase